MERRWSTLWLIGVAVGLVLTFALMSASDGPRSPAAENAPEDALPAAASGADALPAGEVVIELRGMRFEPASLRVAPGTTVRFVNRDPMTHNVVNASRETLGKAPEAFRSPNLGPNESWSVTLDAEGTYPILCTVAGHYLAGMTGEIIVAQDAAEPHAAHEAAAADGAAGPQAAAPRVVRSASDLPGPVRRDHPEHVVVELRTVEVTGELADGLTYTYWTYNGTVPGPMIRVRQGDTVEIRLTNDPSSTQVHSIDLHAVNGPGGGAGLTQVAPGETKAFRFQALNPGVYVYHCATPHVPTHIANGMYGLIVVEPPEGLSPVDHEFYIMQGDMYADKRPGAAGHAEHDADALWREEPSFVVFNGRFQALTGDQAMTVAVGDRVRIFIGNGGPNLASSFHVIGEVFDVVHPQGASEALTNVQTTLIPAGGAAWVEFTVDVPGEYVLVDHALSRAVDKGALAVIRAVGPDNPAVFAPAE